MTCQLVPLTSIDRWAVKAGDFDAPFAVEAVKSTPSIYLPIIGYNCGYYYDCDYWDAYDIRDENKEIKSGTRLASESHLSPCKVLLRAGDFVFTGQPPGG